eukprot:Phypoly_transcript_06300.p1 GENE.Phypoly_transcript_06300~~Phypoly_transcript_06300.p1  ORF type:complete len:572 (+),score=66.81 Phypoly_transcript_06300:79-1794(+)
MASTEGSDSSDHMDARLAEIEKIVSNSENVGPPKRSLHIDDTIFNKDDPQIKEDIIRMIIQHLQDEGYMGSVMTLQDESNVRQTEQITKINHMKKMKKSILEGDWAEVEKLCTKQTFKTQQSFLYAVYKQAYLELLERQEYQKAFTYLTKRLKPLESRQTNIDEFRDLCYLLTCKSVQDVPNFKNWDGGKGSSREKLVEQYQSMLEFDNTKSAGVKIPPTRLLTLLRQAVAYQIEFSRYHPKIIPKIQTLLEDYHAFILPNALKNTLTSHKRNVKCVCFVGEEGLHLASGSSDNTVKLWKSEDGTNVETLTGHAARIWDISSNNSGKFLASAAGDGEVRVWDIKNMNKGSCSLALRVHEGDAYTVQFHPGENHIVTGGYDKTVRLIDVKTGVTIKTFTGHNSSVSKTIFNPHGNLIISGSKDSTIKFWDIVSGLCIKTFSSHLGEVTSVDINSSGSLLLSGSKDNSNRLWDIRTARPIKRFKGHQNTSKNFIRSGFGPNQSLIIGGSEDGYVYIWDIETATILQRLKGHSGMVYSAVWNQSQSLLASCAHDSSVKTWWYDPDVPVYVDSNE